MLGLADTFSSTRSFEKQLKNLLDVLILAIRIPERRNMGIGQALIDGLTLGVVCWTRQECVVVWQIVLAFQLGNAHESLDCAVCRQAATQKHKAVTGKQPFQQLGQWKVEMNIPIVTVGCIVLGLIEYTLRGAIQIAVQL